VKLDAEFSAHLDWTCTLRGQRRWRDRNARQSR